MPDIMLALRTLLLVSSGAFLSGCSNDIFGSPKPASFSSYPVSGQLQSVSVADLEAVAALIKPHKIYGVNIIGRDEIWVQITPTRHGSNSSLAFRHTHGKWLRPDEHERMVTISAIQVAGVSEQTPFTRQ